MKKPLSYKLALKEKQSDLMMVSRIQLGRCFGARRQGKHVAVLDRKAWHTRLKRGFTAPEQESR